MNFNTVALAIGLVLQLATLLFFAGKFANRIDDLERRQTNSEEDMRRWKEEIAKLTAIETKLDILNNELLRVRNRFDSFAQGILQQEIKR
jgi:predicted nucleic acid-binding protein